jgi:hypothetical protein
MKLKINIYAFLFCLISFGTLPAQQEDSILMYLIPFQKTQLIDDHLLLTDNLGLTLDRVPLLSASDGTTLETKALQIPAYFKFDEGLYPIGHEGNLQALHMLIKDSRIDYRPINAGPISYEGYYIDLPLDDTEFLGIQLLNNGFIEMLEIEQ